MDARARALRPPLLEDRVRLGAGMAVGSRLCFFAGEILLNRLLNRSIRHHGAATRPLAKGLEALG
jgi:hypothetical protein